MDIEKLLSQVPSGLPIDIARGIILGDYNRVGGLIIEVASSSIIGVLRDNPQFVENHDPSSTPKQIPKTQDSQDSQVGPTNWIGSLLSSTAKTAAAQFDKLNPILERFIDTENNPAVPSDRTQESRPSSTDQILLATTAAYVQQIGMLSLSSTLALSVATMEFEVIKKRLQGIEESLQRIEESLQQIQSKLDNVEDKLDLNIFSNFQAALDQAGNSSSMNNPENRRNSAHQAINRFLEAEHYYADLYKYELSKGRGEAVLDILHILSLAYVSEARCHLELGEAQTANQRLSKAREQLEFCVRELIQCTLTHNPAMYLNPAMQEKGVGLDRLTHYMQWLDPSLTPCSVFEALRGDLWEFAGGGKIIDRWLDSLPLMLWDPQVDEPKNRRGRRKEISNKEKLQILLLRLPDALLRVDSAIECHGRLQGFELETQVLARERITLQKWQQLTSVKQSNEQPFSYVKLLKPISVDSYN